MKKFILRTVKMAGAFCIIALVYVILCLLPETPLICGLKSAVKFLGVAYIVVSVLFMAMYVVYLVISQFHCKLEPTSPEESKENVIVEETEDLYIVYPQYDSIQFVTRKRPSRLSRDITLCCGATFRRTYNPFFFHKELVDIHVEKGVLYHGYHFGGLGAFTYYDNAYHFANDLEAEDELKKAAERGGYGFMQHMIMDDGKIVCIPMYKQKNKRRIYRMLAEHDHKLCIMDSKKPVVYRDFAEAVAAYGAEHALFMDNGHWCYAWYRDNSGNTKRMVGLPWPLSDNWLVFRHDKNSTV